MMKLFKGLLWAVMTGNNNLVHTLINHSLSLPHSVTAPVVGYTVALMPALPVAVCIMDCLLPRKPNSVPILDDIHGKNASDDGVFIVASVFMCEYTLIALSMFPCSVLVYLLTNHWRESGDSAVLPAVLNLLDHYSYYTSTIILLPNNACM